MAAGRVVFMFFCMGLSTAQYYEGELCQTKNRLTGECQLLYNCPAAEKFIKTPRLIPKTFSRCGFKDTTEIICCPLSDMEIPPKDNDFINADFYFDDIGKATVATIVPPTLTENRIRLRKCVEACNKYVRDSPLTLTPHILDGEEVRQGDFPHMVALGYDSEGQIAYNCGGTLISNRYVLTAAHCILNIERIKPTVARIGSVFLKDTLGIEYNIERDIVHPRYNRSQRYYDIALLRLDRDVDFNGEIHPACLDIDTKDPVGPVIITGWGTTNIRTEAKSDVLLRANLTTVSITQCNITFTEPSDLKRLPFGITANQMCAMDTLGNADSCQGDSGGPLQIKRPGDENFYTLIGLTSFGRTCGTSNPGVYTRVSSFLDWIENEVWPNAV